MRWKQAASLFVLAIAVSAAPVFAAEHGGKEHGGTAEHGGSTTAAPAAAAASKDIVDTAVGAGQFNTLAKALQAAGLVEALKGPGPYTVFAPTDAAFAKLPPGALDGLLQDPAELTKVLLYHVVPGKVTSKEVVAMTAAPTLEGSTLSISAGAGGVKVNGANVTQTDIEASNGVIHVIDTVVMPES